MLGGSSALPTPGKKQLSLSDTLKLAWADSELRQRMSFVLMVFVIYAFAVHVPVPLIGIDPAKLDQMMQGNAFLQMLNMFGGGAFRRVSILALGLGPYITASIIMQVLSLSVPSWKQEMQEGGQYARNQQNRRTRGLALILCLVQSTVVYNMLNQMLNLPGWQPQVIAAIFWTAGSFGLLWLGEQVSERGIGNGVSLLIFAGIVLSFPGIVDQIRVGIGSAIEPWRVVVIAILFVVMTWLVVRFTQAQRRIPIQHMRRNYGTKTLGGQTSYLPISVNMAGVIPIIFAITLLYLPAQMASMFPIDTPAGATLNNIAEFFNPDFTKVQGFVAALIFMALIFVFTFIWNAMVYNVDDITNNLKKAGSYIPGIRPGKQTKDFLNGVITRVTFMGALFLSVVAVTQFIFPTIGRFSNAGLIGGSSLLIMVSVALETMRQIEANLLVKQYGE